MKPVNRNFKKVRVNNYRPKYNDPYQIMRLLHSKTIVLIWLYFKTLFLADRNFHQYLMINI